MKMYCGHEQRPEHVLPCRHVFCIDCTLNIKGLVDGSVFACPACGNFSQYIEPYKTVTGREDTSVPRVNSEDCTEMTSSSLNDDSCYSPHPRSTQAEDTLNNKRRDPQTPQIGQSVVERSAVSAVNRHEHHNGGVNTHRLSHGKNRGYVSTENTATRSTNHYPISPSNNQPLRHERSDSSRFDREHRGDTLSTRKHASNENISEKSYYNYRPPGDNQSLAQTRRDPSSPSGEYRGQLSTDQRSPDRPRERRDAPAGCLDPVAQQDNLGTAHEGIAQPAADAYGSERTGNEPPRENNKFVWDTCRTHRKDICFYCKDCREPVCERCCGLEGHIVVTADIMGRDFKNTLDNFRDEIRSHEPNNQENIEEVIGKAEEFKKSIKRATEEAKAKLDSNKDVMIAQIEKRLQESIESRSRFCQTKMDKVKEANEILRTAAAALASGDLITLTSAVDDVQKHLQWLKEKSPEDMFAFTLTTNPIADSTKKEAPVSLTPYMS